ncbi:MAG TPA: selenoneine synthase SenA [Candidatus Acidoferrales bacterium]|nr:selenoneine synthase SenA [Candidatus Acidoferrales bacterium]
MTAKGAAELIGALGEARARTLALVSDLSDEQMIGPKLKIVNPLLWEIGHVAWFQERWALRHLRGERPILEGGDALYDSANVAHDTRWELWLPTREKTLEYMQLVLHRVIDRLGAGAPTPEEAYFHWLAIFHEDMHDEAITYTRQTLGYPPPVFGVSGDGNARAPEGGPLPGDAEVPGGTFLLGATPDLPFVFDNEKWAHPVTVAPFRIARAAVTNEEFLAFVEDRGYLDRRWWSEAGWKWRAENGALHPVYWQREANGRWLQRVFDRFVPLRPHAPVVHVNWFEAEAYCNWAGRRLPTEAEWELAAASGERKRMFPWGDEAPTPQRANLDWSNGGCLDVGALPAGDSAFGCRQMIGNVWEWTASDFMPYPGFVVDPYKEYSQPWFGDHKVLRGGCWTTRSRLIRNTWRNFYTPDRRDVWAGFRTCAR